MEVVVDLAGGVVTLGAPDDFGRFAVRVVGVEQSGREGEQPAVGSIEQVAAALGRERLGRLDTGGEALVDQAAVRRLAAVGTPTEEWDARFAEMVAHAAAHGWTGPDGEIRAHLEWGPE